MTKIIAVKVSVKIGYMKLIGYFFHIETSGQSNKSLIIPGSLPECVSQIHQQEPEGLPIIAKFN